MKVKNFSFKGYVVIERDLFKDGESLTEAYFMAQHYLDEQFGGLFLISRMIGQPKDSSLFFKIPFSVIDVKKLTNAIKKL